MPGRINTKHPPSRPLRQSARDPREVVHWLRPATTRVRTATPPFDLLDLPVLPHHPPPLTTTDRIHHHRLATQRCHQHSTRTPPACSAGVFVASRSPVQSALSSRYYPFVRSHHTHVHPASLLRPSGHPPTHSYYRPALSLANPANSTWCPTQRYDPQQRPARPATTLSDPDPFHHFTC